MLGADWSFEAIVDLTSVKSEHSTQIVSISPAKDTIGDAQRLSVATWPCGLVFGLDFVLRHCGLGTYADNVEEGVAFHAMLDQCDSEGLLPHCITFLLLGPSRRAGSRSQSERPGGRESGNQASLNDHE